VSGPHDEIIDFIRRGRAGGMDQVVECLSGKLNALSSKTSVAWRSCSENQPSSEGQMSFGFTHMQNLDLITDNNNNNRT
jgi:hypothetical protein